MCEDMSAAVGEVKLVVVAMQAICCVFPYALNDNGCHAAKILYVAVITDYHKIPWAKHLVNCWFGFLYEVVRICIGEIMHDHGFNSYGCQGDSLALFVATADQS